MEKDNVLSLGVPELGASNSRSVLEELAREGARRMLQEALECEVEEFVANLRQSQDPAEPAPAVRNGYLPARKLVSGIGPLEIKQPRVRLRGGTTPAETTADEMSEADSSVRFSSAILPPYLRRLPGVDALIPALYLKGISTGDFQEALAAILGPQVVGLSAANIVRLKSIWEDEYKVWCQRDLSSKRYVYWWADGIHFNVRLDDERSCILVLMGALEDGRKEIIAVQDGYRESKQSWKELLADLKQRGLNHGPKLAVGDGALGFWGALSEEFGEVRGQRCWVHKTANVLDKMPKSVQASAKKRIHDIYLAPTKKAAVAAFDDFIGLYGDKYPKACGCLQKDKEEMLAFYDFPAQHWSHIRSTNPIESTFATVRLRTKRTKGCGSRTATLTMVFKLALAAQAKWRRINAPQVLGKIMGGLRFEDGEEVVAVSNNNEAIAA
jgi:putative transposase